MTGNRTWGVALVALGVLVNNYSYLHDVVMGKHDGMIYAGPWTFAGIAVGLAMIAAGVRTLLRSPEMPT
jgi:hypothetical protein